MPILLLDFDGVLLRKHPIYESVSVRCQSYAQKFIPLRNPVKIKQTNQELYESYGHTMLGLRALGYPVELSDFNHQVYSNIDLKSLINVRETHKQDIEAIKTMLSTVRDAGIEYRLFTNAPDIWCQTILQHMGLDAIEKANIASFLKPEQASYERIEKMFPNERHFIFVDDKLVNLKGVMKRPTWHRVLFMGADATDVTHYELPYVSVLNNLAHLTSTRAWKEAVASIPVSKRATRGISSNSTSNGTGTSNGISKNKNKDALVATGYKAV